MMTMRRTGVTRNRFLCMNNRNLTESSIGDKS